MGVGLRDRFRLAAKALVGLFDENSAKQAFGLLAGLYPSSSGAMPDRGTFDILKGYSQMPWLRACAGKVSFGVANTQWQLFAPKSGKKVPKTLQKATGDFRIKLIEKGIESDELRQIEDHILLDALDKANQYLVGNALLRITQVHLDLVGEAFWIKERNQLGAPVGFWPIPPHWVKETPTISRRSYRVEWQQWHGEIPDTEIVWFCDPDPANPYGRGSGMARTLADELETDEYAARHTRMTFINRARPDMIVWPEETKQSSGVISAENAQRLGERWRAEHQGFWRAAMPFFATQKLGVHSIQQSFQELSLVPLREHERDIIHQVWGIPPEMLGIIEPGTARATIETGEYIYEKHVIEPRREFLRSILQERLVPEYDERLIISFVSTVTEDRQFVLKTAQAAPHTRTVDEWRKLQGLGPLENGAGKMFIYLDNTLAVDTPSQLPSEPPRPAPPKPEGQPGKPSATAKPKRGIDFEMGFKYRDVEEAVVVARDSGDAPLEALLTNAMAEDPDDLPELARRAGQKEAALRRVIFNQLEDLRERTSEEAIIVALASADSERIVSAVPLQAWATTLREPSEGWLRDTFLIGAFYGAEAAGIQIEREAARLTFNQVNPEAIEWARTYAASLVADISASTLAGIRESVVQALKQGWPADKLARVIRDSLGLTSQQSAAVVRFAQRLFAEGHDMETILSRVARYAKAQRRARALMIARTELMTAANAGQQRLWDIASQRGLLDKSGLRKKWLATFDELLEPVCEQLAFEAPVPLDKPFSTGKMTPPQHPNCRCSVGLVPATAPQRAAIQRIVVVEPKTAIDDAVIKRAVHDGFSLLDKAFKEVRL